MFLPGRMSREFLGRLLAQRDRSQNSFFESIYLPGISVCYTDYDDAIGTLLTEFVDK